MLSGIGVWETAVLHCAEVLGSSARATALSRACTSCRNIPARLQSLTFSEIRLGGGQRRASQR
eukprot:12929269-Prorocentrum_lima.AAC.1